MPLNRVHFGWANLTEALNTIVDWCNGNTIEAGRGISIDRGSGAVIISTTPPNSNGDADSVSGSGTSSGSSNPPDGSTAAWQLIQVLDATTGTVFSKWVWGGDSFDPVSCSSVHIP